MEKGPFVPLTDTPMCKMPPPIHTPGHTDSQPTPPNPQRSRVGSCHVSGFRPNPAHTAGRIFWLCLRPQCLHVARSALGALGVSVHLAAGEQCRSRPGENSLRLRFWGRAFPPRFWQGKLRLFPWTLKLPLGRRPRHQAQLRRDPGTDRLGSPGKDSLVGSRMARQLPTMNHSSHLPAPTSLGWGDTGARE